MTGDTQIAPKATHALAKKELVLPPTDLSQKQRLFADAMTKAETKPQAIRKKLADDQPVGLLMTLATGYAAAAPEATPATASTDPVFAAHIERIAAAIAEVAASGAKSEIHLQLPPGATRVDGAVIGRDAMGALHIVLTTASDIPPANAAQLQSQLTERLLRREIRVAKLGLQRIDRRESEA